VIQTVAVLVLYVSWLLPLCPPKMFLPRKAEYDGTVLRKAYLPCVQRPAVCRDGTLAPLTEECVQVPILVTGCEGAVVDGACGKCLLHTAPLLTVVVNVEKIE